MDDIIRNVKRIDMPMEDYENLVRLHKPDRRERVATALMVGLLAHGTYVEWEDIAQNALDGTDALIAALDKEDL